MIPKTQSVCKHCGEPRTSYIHAPDLSDRAHVFEPVSEPASTGEPPPDRYDELQRAGCLVGCYWNYLDSPNQFIEHVEGCPNKIPAARPSEPSAPTVEPIIHARTKVSEGEHLSAPRKSAIEIAGERDLRVITEPIDWEAVENDAAPQTSAEQIEEKLFLYNKEGFEKMPAPQPVSGDAPDMNDPRYCGACKHIHPPHEVDCRCYCDKVSCPECGPRIAARVMADPAPQPTPSVSTEPQMMITPGGDIHEYCPDCRGVCKQVRPAPSVAGTQPTPEERELLLAQFFPQGTPQVEEISREIAEKLAAMHLIVWQGLGQAMDEYAKEAAAILRKHGVGAPAQPGTEEKK